MSPPVFSTRLQGTATVGSLRLLPTRLHALGLIGMEIRSVIDAHQQVKSPAHCICNRSVKNVIIQKEQA